MRGQHLTAVTVDDFTEFKCTACLFIIFLSYTVTESILGKLPRDTLFDLLPVP